MKDINKYKFFYNYYKPSNDSRNYGNFLSDYTFGISRYRESVKNFKELYLIIKDKYKVKEGFSNFLEEVYTFNYNNLITAEAKKKALDAFWSSLSFGSAVDPFEHQKKLEKALEKSNIFKITLTKRLKAMGLASNNVENNKIAKIAIDNLKNGDLQSILLTSLQNEIRALVVSGILEFTNSINNATKYVTLYSKNKDLINAWELTLRIIDNDAKKALTECFSWMDDYDNVAKPKLNDKVDSENFYKDLNNRIKQREIKDGKKPVGIRFAPSGVFKISL
ncbi:MAG: hypothetical protein MR423_01275 [Firmicutes bacterium]|nr:hypothetical protein [Bacillota bacterium]